MKIKEQTRKQAAGCSNTVLRLWIELTKSAQNTILRLQMEADVVWRVWFI